MPTGLGDEIAWYVPTLVDSANDQSGNAHHGTYTGGMQTVADTGSGGVKSYELDGTDDYIDISGVLSDPSIVSLSIWVKQASTTDIGMIFAHRDSSNDLIQLWLDDDVPTFHIRSSVTSLVTLTTSAITNTSWYHFAIITEKSGNHKLYLDGTEVDTDSTAMSGTISSTKQFVGAYDSGSGAAGFFNGRLDDVRFFDRALSAAEITHLASARGVQGTATTPFAETAPIAVAWSIVDPTATAQTGDFAALAPLSVALSVVATTATATEIAANVVALATTFGIVEPTATWVAPVTAALSPMAAAFTIPSVTATSGGITGFERSLRGYGRGILVGVA